MPASLSSSLDMLSLSHTSSTRWASDSNSDDEDEIVWSLSSSAVLSSSSPSPLISPLSETADFVLVPRIEASAPNALTTAATTTATATATNQEPLAPVSQPPSALTPDGIAQDMAALSLSTVAPSQLRHNDDAQQPPTTSATVPAPATKKACASATNNEKGGASASASAGPPSAAAAAAATTQTQPRTPTPPKTTKAKKAKKARTVHASLSSSSSSSSASSASSGSVSAAVVVAPPTRQPRPLPPLPLPPPPSVSSSSSSSSSSVPGKSKGRLRATKKKGASESASTHAPPGLGLRAVVDDSSLSEVSGEEILSSTATAATAATAAATDGYHEAQKFMTSYLAHPPPPGNNGSALLMLQALILELGCLPDGSSKKFSIPELPGTLRQAKLLLKSRAFINVRDYLAVRDQGQAALRSVMHPCRKSLVREVRKGKRVPVHEVKKAGLKVLLVNTRF